MGYHLFREPVLHKPVMIACWPGIGNIGLLAVDALREQVKAEEIGEIEPWDYFYPKKVVIKAGVLEDMQLPSSKFYYQRIGGEDVLFFIGEEQPGESGRMYAEGVKAYQIANLVLDVAEKFGCYRVYTSGAAVALIHHEMRPRVWIAGGSEKLNKTVRRFPNTVLMSEIEGKGNQGSITGLNGLLLGIAKKRGFETVSLMGEIPDYLSRAPFPYHRAAKSVLEVLSGILNITLDCRALDEMDSRMQEVINGIYEKFPPDVKEKIELRRSALQARPEIITDEDERWIKEHIDDLFRRGDRNERSS